MPSHRFSHASCSRFLPVLEQLCRDEPDQLEVNYIGLEIGPATASARLRDALIAYTQEKLPLTEGITDIRRVWRNYNITISDDDRVLLVKKGTVKRPIRYADGTSTATARKEPEAVTIKVPPNAPIVIMQALILLISEKILPPTDVMYDVPTTLYALAEERDVAVVPNSSGGYTLC